MKQICKKNILSFLLLENLKADTTKIIRDKIDELSSSRVRQTPQKPLLDSILEDISQSQIKPLLDASHSKLTPDIVASGALNRNGLASSDFSSCMIPVPLQDALRDAPQVSHFGSLITPKKASNTHPMHSMRLQDSGCRPPHLQHQA